MDETTACMDERRAANKYWNICNAETSCELCPRQTDHQAWHPSNSAASPTATESPMGHVELSRYEVERPNP